MTLTVIFNYISLRISNCMKFLLSFGLDFGLQVYKLDFIGYFLAFDKMVNSLNHSQFLDSIQAISKKFFYNFKPYKIFSAIFTSHDVKQLKSLSTDTSVIISKPDKGRAVVLVDREKYVASMSSIISDVDKFTEIKEPIHKFTLRVEDMINYFLK